jgi:hypothetical protein
MKQKKISKAHCNKCLHETDHLILARRVKSDSEPDANFWCEETADVVECCGCHTLSLRVTTITSEDEHPQIIYYPPRVSRQKPSWGHNYLLNAPFQLQGLLDEVYSALHAGNLRLATMGARCLFDMAILDTVGDVGTFKTKLKALIDKGYIGTRQKDILETALEMGHAASHRGHRPTPSDLDAVMDIVENLLQMVYALTPAASDLRKKTPPRQKPLSGKD